MGRFDLKIRKTMLRLLIQQPIRDMTCLATETARYFGRTDWLDDDLHPLWDLASEFFPTTVTQ